MSIPVFVFGSNLAGRHSKGAAKFAKDYRGAIQGQGIGRQGNSYAIPTKDAILKTLPIERIYVYVRDFIDYAHKHQNLQFEVTKIGCGPAGYREHQISALFRDAPSNCILPSGWRTS